MIKVTVTNNVKRETVYVYATDTLSAAMAQAGIEPRGMLYLDGAALGAGDATKTFADYGYTGEDGKNSCFLSQVVKADNA